MKQNVILEKKRFKSSQLSLLFLYENFMFKCKSSEKWLHLKNTNKDD